jgi:hypothetical protein
MAYNKKQIYEQALELSKKMGFFFVQDIIDYLCVSKQTFYTYFPENSDELDALKENLYKNRITQKINLRKRLSEGNGTEIIALYKLIGTDEERKALSTNWNNSDITSKGEKLQSTIIVQDIATRDNLERLKNEND